MARRCLLGLVLLTAATPCFATDPLVRNYSASNVPSVATDSTYVPAGIVAGESTVVSGQTADVMNVAFGHRRHCSSCGGYGSGMAPTYGAGYGTYGAGYGASGTYQPSYYGAYYGGYNPGLYASGYVGAYPHSGAAYNPAYVYRSPNPYGYYPNVQIWGSSGPWYGQPFPVWNSPSNYYAYRYQGWGSYGWGGWGGTGPAGWGYQGGFYW